MADWNADQYLKFRAQRTLPAVDLAEKIGLANPETILDIGCGPGNSTAVLRKKYPNAKILGIDVSENMIETAKKTYPDMDFLLLDAGKDLDKLNRTFDAAFSNACIQWIPNHRTLIPSMLSVLNVGGVLAVQIPMNYDEPIHQIIGRLAASDRWREKLGTPRVFHNLPQGEYFDLLAEHASDFTMWQTTYFHRMASHDAIMEWYSGTGLRPYLNALADEADRARFYKEVFDEVKQAYPVQENGEIIFRFPRLFFTAVK